MWAWWLCLSCELVVIRDSLPSALGVWVHVSWHCHASCLVFFEVCQLELGTTLFPKTLQYFNCFYEVIAKLLVAAIGPWHVSFLYDCFFGPSLSSFSQSLRLLLGWWNLWKKEELILWPCGLFAKIPTWIWTSSRLGQYVYRDGLVKLTKLVVLG